MKGLLTAVALIASIVGTAQTNKLIGVLTVSYKSDPSGKETKVDIYEVYGSYERSDRYVDLRKMFESKTGKGASAYFDYYKNCAQWIASFNKNFSKKERKNIKPYCMYAINDEGIALKATDSRRGVALGVMLIHYGSKATNRIDKTMVYEVQGNTLKDPAGLAGILAPKYSGEFIGYEYLAGKNCTGDQEILKKKLGVSYFQCTPVKSGD